MGFGIIIFEICSYYFIPKIFILETVTYSDTFFTITNIYNGNDSRIPISENIFIKKQHVYNILLWYTVLFPDYILSALGKI